MRKILLIAVSLSMIGFTASAADGIDDEVSYISASEEEYPHIGTIVYKNETTMNGKRIEQKTISTSQGDITVEVNRIGNKECYDGSRYIGPEKCMDTLYVVDKPDGVVISPSIVEAEEGSMTYMRVFVYIGG